LRGLLRRRDRPGLP